MKMEVKPSGIVIITPEKEEKIRQIFIYTREGVLVSKDKLNRLHITITEGSTTNNE